MALRTNVSIISFLAVLEADMMTFVGRPSMLMPGNEVKLFSFRKMRMLHETVFR
jgi:hypothetical protein